MRIEVLQSSSFARKKKKLYKKQIKVLDDEVKKIVKNREIGQQKRGDLKNIRVHKFKVDTQVLLLAYQCKENRIYLIAIASHEGFYKNLKQYLK
jgi:mRNA-degrading endonuclease RelE of RelBE toxin-antitoxin system